MEDRDRKSIEKLLNEFLDTSKSRVDMSKVSESEMDAFTRAMSYASSFVPGETQSSKAGNIVDFPAQSEKSQKLVAERSRSSYGLSRIEDEEKADPEDFPLDEVEMLQRSFTTRTRSLVDLLYNE